jgi:hypothetical protein
MAKVSKISDKLVKVNESYTVNMYDNGFMFEIGGQDANSDWKTSKIMCTSVDDVIALVIEATELPRND